MIWFEGFVAPDVSRKVEFEARHLGKEHTIIGEEILLVCLRRLRVFRHPPQRAVLSRGIPLDRSFKRSLLNPLSRTIHETLQAL